MNINQEEIYSLIKEKKWSQLLGIIETYSKDTALEQDQLITYALKFFEQQFFGDLDNNLKNDDSQTLLETIDTLHKRNSYKFSEENFDQVVNILEERRIAPILKQINKLIQTKEWFQLINVIHENYRHQPFLNNKSILNLLKIFELQFCKDLENDLKNANSQSVLETIFALDKGRVYVLSDHTLTQVVAKLAKVYEQQGSRQEAYNFAKMRPSDPICAAIIKSYEESNSILVEHSQIRKIQVTTNEKIISPNIDYTRSLFGTSLQEKYFYDACRDRFPSHIIYPNVALKVVIETKKIESKLSQKELDFFYKAIIDCVIFDQDNNYKPIYFFELDSRLHDTPEARQKDKWKDKIFGIAGHKLYRIRRIAKHQGKDEFIQVIKEIFGK
jgi:hypothetical protein